MFLEQLGVKVINVEESIAVKAKNEINKFHFPSFLYKTVTTWCIWDHVHNT